MRENIDSSPTDIHDLGLTNAPTQTRDMLESSGDEECSILLSTVKALANWSRKNSVWPLPLGLSCCGFEFMATAASRYDMSRFGMEVARFSPRQADLMLVAGTLTYKMAQVMTRLYDQMAEPKWVIAMGACASSGGMYRTYSVVQGIDEFVPVDFYISGCPPRPDSVMNVLMKLQDKIDRDTSYNLEFEAPESGAPKPVDEKASLGGRRHGPPVALATANEHYGVEGPQRRMARGIKPEEGR